MVGPGKRFLSGLTYYTYMLAEGLSTTQRTSAIFLRQLLPARWYPGHERVGADLSHLRLGAHIPRFDGVDWFWLPSLLQALYFLRKQRPDVLLVEWWTAAAAHTQLALAIAARLLGARVVIEFHEVIDPGEAERPWVRRYSRIIGPILFRLADRHIAHSKFDLELLREHYRLPPDRIDVIPHLVHHHYKMGTTLREAPDDACNILYFGVIRPFKGVEDLIAAFERIPADQIGSFWLTIVGETWEGWTVPAERVAASPYRERITFVNRYVTDEEVDGWFNGADVVALPYHRSSMSGPLHVAMSYGLPVVTTDVGGLTEAVEHYPGAVLTAPKDPDALHRALLTVADLSGATFNADTLERTIPQFNATFSRLSDGATVGGAR